MHHIQFHIQFQLDNRYMHQLIQVIRLNFVRQLNITFYIFVFTEKRQRWLINPIYKICKTILLHRKHIDSRWDPPDIQSWNSNSKIFHKILKLHLLIVFLGVSQKRRWIFRILPAQAAVLVIEAVAAPGSALQLTVKLLPE